MTSTPLCRPPGIQETLTDPTGWIINQVGQIGGEGRRSSGAAAGAEGFGDRGDVKGHYARWLGIWSQNPLGFGNHYGRMAWRRSCASRQTRPRARSGRLAEKAIR